MAIGSTAAAANARRFRRVSPSSPCVVVSRRVRGDLGANPPVSPPPRLPSRVYRGLSVPHATNVVITVATGLAKPPAPGAADGRRLSQCVVDPTVVLRLGPRCDDSSGRLTHSDRLSDRPVQPIKDAASQPPQTGQLVGPMLFGRCVVHRDRPLRQL